jgi:hypothetical protein
VPSGSTASRPSIFKRNPKPLGFIFWRPIPMHERQSPPHAATMVTRGTSGDGSDLEVRASDETPFARQLWFPEERAATTTPKARAWAVAQVATSGQRLMRRRHEAWVAPSSGRARGDRLRRQWPHEVWVAPVALAIARGACYEGRRSAWPFRHPSETNSSDLVALVASSGDDLLQSFVLCMRLLVDPILHFFH